MMSQTTTDSTPPTEVPEKAQRRTFTAEYKRRILREVDACKELEDRLGADPNLCVAVTDPVLQTGSPAVRFARVSALNAGHRRPMYAALQLWIAGQEQAPPERTGSHERDHPIHPRRRRLRHPALMGCVTR